MLSVQREGRGRPKWLAERAELMKSQLQTGNSSACACGDGEGLIPVKVRVIGLLCCFRGRAGTYLFCLVHACEDDGNDRRVELGEVRGKGVGEGG